MGPAKSHCHWDGRVGAPAGRVLDRLRRTPALRLCARRGRTRVATTTPADSCRLVDLATGVNPGRHGIFDFLGRDPQTYLPQLALNRYEQKNAFVPPKVVNMRRGAAIWQILSKAGIPSVILRCPCTNPPDPHQGRMLAGMGVPDVRGSLGMSTFYTRLPIVDKVKARMSFAFLRRLAGQDRSAWALHPKTRQPVELPITLERKAASDAVLVHSDGQSRVLKFASASGATGLR